jgi:FlaA1/EpsC-like NDP-sugar epimerase
VNDSKGNFSGRVVLITGAGGCIGSALARRILQSDPALVLLHDHSEQNIYDLHSELSATTSSSWPQPLGALPPNSPHIPIVGDVLDDDLLNEILEKHRPQVIYHAAAFKHVPLMESNPFAAIRNNVLGTWTLANAALRHGVPHLLMISTDKAVNPRSVMGCAKRVAELILLRLSTPGTRMSALRLGNVFGSHGSVVPLFQQQIARGGPITVTHPESRRYFLALPDAVELILAADRIGASVFVPELAEPVKIVELAKRLVREAGYTADEIEITFTGLRPGDKLTEELVAATEWLEATSGANLRRVNGPQPSAGQLDSAMQAIAESLRARNLSALLDTLCMLVPEYRPSGTVLSLASRHTEAIQAL